MTCSQKQLLLYREASAKADWRVAIESPDSDPNEVERLQQIAADCSFELKAHLTSCRECLTEV